MTLGRNKYGATPTVIGGVRFASLREARRWADLCLLSRAGEIRDLRRQVAVPLYGRDGPLLTRTGRQMKITVDFVYQDRSLDWAVVYEDAKGMATRDYEVRRAVAAAMGIEVRET